MDKEYSCNLRKELVIRLNNNKNFQLDFIDYKILLLYNRIMVELHNEMGDELKK